jgi:hypothetical protein
MQRIDPVVPPELFHLAAHLLMLKAKFFPPAAPFPHLTADFSKNAVEFSLPTAELAAPTGALPDAPEPFGIL